MLTYTPPEQYKDAPSAREKPWVLWLMGFAWLWPGIFSHDLWQPAEPKIFAAIRSLEHGASWLAPEVLGQPSLQTPPGYIWLGWLAKTVLSPRLMDAYEAVRMVSLLFMAVGFIAAGAAGHRLLGKRHGRILALLLLGCPGFMMAGHTMDIFALEFAGLALSVCGISAVKQQTALAALLMGMGSALVFWAGGLWYFAALWLCFFTLPAVKIWRCQNYAVALFAAACLALPLVLLWPYLLVKSDPALFYSWWRNYAWGSWGGMTGFTAGFKFGFLAQTLVWFALPALALSAWSLAQWRDIAAPVRGLVLLWIGIFGTAFVLMPDNRAEDTLPIALMLAVLGTARLDHLRTGAASFWNWFGIMLFGAAALAVWLVFFAINYGWPQALAERAAAFNPFYRRHMPPLSMLVAISFTPLWLWAVTRKHVRARQALSNWTAGVILVWSLGMTLFLPWLDSVMSYRPQINALEKSFPLEARRQIAQGQTCLSGRSADTNITLAWQEYSQMPLLTDNRNPCRYALMWSRTGEAPAHWHLVGSVPRPRHSSGHYLIVQRMEKTQ